MREAPAVEGFGAGGFRVAGERIEGSLLIVDDEPGLWPVSSILAELAPEDFATILGAPQGSVEFVLLGTGDKVAPAPRPVREAMAAAGLGLEVMSTAEAIRLYNLLASDGRRIAAALLAV